MPMAEINGASRNEPRSGRYATRSIVQLTSEVNAMATISMMTRSMTGEAMPSQVVMIR